MLHNFLFCKIADNNCNRGCKCITDGGRGWHCITKGEGGVALERGGAGGKRGEQMPVCVSGNESLICEIR